MTVATVSSKGQITLPVQARRAAGIEIHDRVMIEVDNGCIMVGPVRRFMELGGFLGKARSLTDEREAMSKAVAEHVEKKA